MSECYIGVLLNDCCHLDHYTNFKALCVLSDLSSDDLLLLSYRIKHFDLEAKTNSICNHHIYKYLHNYTARQYKCCDPFKSHKTNILTTLRTLNTEVCLEFSKVLKKNIDPGNKYCNNCRAKLDKLRKSVDNNQIKDPVSERTRSKVSRICKKDKYEIDTPDSHSIHSSGSDFITNSQEHLKLKRMLEGFDESPLKRGKNNDECLKSEVYLVLERMNEKFLLTVNKTLNLDIPISINIKQSQEASKSMQQMLSNLIFSYKQQTKVSGKISLLTLLPLDWKYGQAKHYFSCSRYLFNKSIELRKHKGVLGEVERKEYYIYSSEIRDSIINYYRDDSNSKLCSGVKDCISVKNAVTNEKEKLQKRILIYDLKDMYGHWLKDNESLKRKPSFSLFAQLRPKECLLSGSPGTHSICVCSLHQNIKLKLAAFNNHLYYRDIFESAVCSTDNKDCMLHNCEICKGVEEIQKILNLSITENRKTVSFSNWKSNSNSDEQSSQITLQKLEEPINLFIENLANDLWELTEHHFIAEKQKEYLSFCKENLAKDSCIILMDFAENFTFICQDSIQAYYFSSKQATVHPFIVYYRQDVGDNTITIKTLSICVISDHLKHTASVVNLFQEKVIELLKRKLPFIKSVTYMSDGSPTQYKNKNNFTDICHHKDDFDMELIEYNFFASSHGKSPCDGIGATAKRSTRRATLQRSADDQILTPFDMYRYLDNNVTGISFLWVEDNEVKERVNKLEPRFKRAKTIPNTRKYHFFKPLDKSKILVKYFSFDDHYKTIKIN